MAGVYLFMDVGARRLTAIRGQTRTPDPTPPLPRPRRDGTGGSQTQMVEYSKSQAGIHVFPFKPSCWNPHVFFAPRPHRFEPITSPSALIHPAAFFL